MHFIPKHSSARKSSTRTRAFGVAVASAATIVGGLAMAPSASAAPSNVWDRVAACESGGNWSIASGNGYSGGLQFNSGSWRAAGGTRYASAPHRATRAQQIAAGQQLLRMQGPGAWPVCSKKAGLTRSNGLSSGGGAMTASRSMARKATTSKAPALKSVADPMTIRRMQSWIGQQRTGKWSTRTTAALQRKVSAKADGVIGPETVRKTERAVGAKVSGKSHFTAPTMRTLSAFVAR
ncbi:MAG: transglycosylase family protein [Micrococcales bacterium]|nr:transglycosylase family protein [Micrococcales bacterium]